MSAPGSQARPHQSCRTQAVVLLRHRGQGALGLQAVPQAVPEHNYRWSLLSYVRSVR
jgi:hypothetical protein